MLNERRETKQIVGELFLDLAEVFVMAFSIFFVVYLLFMQPHQVDGESMVPNFLDKEYLLTDKISYRFRDPKRGEIVVFHAPDNAPCNQEKGCDYIKRIIAVPGDLFEIKQNEIYLNNELLEESYIPDSYRSVAGTYTKQGPVYLDDNEYMVLGDNRGRSSDSREWGPISKEAIVGRTFFRYWPIKKIGTIKVEQLNDRSN